jgi:hypothetical protein
MIMLASCKKTTGTTAFNCDNLVNDTSATNDSTYIEVPNAYSPNGDGINDFWVLYHQNINIVSGYCNIYDERGTMVDSVAIGGATSGEIDYIPNSSKTYVHYYYKLEALTINNKVIGKCGDLYIFLKCTQNINIPLDFIGTGISVVNDPAVNNPNCINY